MKPNPELKEKLDRAIRNFRFANPQMRKWPNDQVLEAMFLKLSEQHPERVRVTGRGSDGKLIFKINLAPDGSDEVW